MAGAKCFLKTLSNFQLPAMFEGSEALEVEGGSTESRTASSISACKKVLSSSTVLDSSDYWQRNGKSLCRLGLLDDYTKASCNMICFVTLDPKKTDFRDDKIIKNLASISPDLRKLIDFLDVHQPKQNEILLLNGLEASETSLIHLNTQGQLPQQRSIGVCLCQCSGKKHYTHLSSIIFEITKFLTGLQWGKEHLQQVSVTRQRVEDDTNCSISSIEEDFLTASEHPGTDSEDDSLRNDPDSGELTEISVEITEPDCARLASQKVQLTCHQCRDDGDIKREMCQHSTPHSKESAGHYATNLAESVLQDAFIRLSQDETSFVSEAAISVSLTQCASTSTSVSKIRHSSKQDTSSFELPRIVIVQSPDCSESSTEWPETQLSNMPDQATTKTIKTLKNDKREQANFPHHNGGHPSKHVEMALACAASVVGTLTSPQVVEKLTFESASEEETKDELQEPEERCDYSFPSAMCEMAQVAGAAAAVELTEKVEWSVDSEADEVYRTSQGVMCAAEASAAFTLHCSVAEGTSIEAFRANIAEVLHREAAEVLNQPQGYRSVAHLLETTHNKIVDGITCPKKSYMDERQFDDIINDVADSLFKYALEKAKIKREMDGPGKNTPNLQVFLQDIVNNLLFDILCHTQKKISHISQRYQHFESLDHDTCIKEHAPTKNGDESLSQLQRLGGYSQSTNKESNGITHNTVELTDVSGLNSVHQLEESDVTVSSPTVHKKEQKQQSSCRHPKFPSFSAKDESDLQQIQWGCSLIIEPFSDVLVQSTERRRQQVTGSENRLASQSTQSSFSSCSSCSSVLSWRTDSESRTPIICYADDMAATVVSMATELAAICLENSIGKQPWFCGLKGTNTEGPEAYLFTSCRSVLRRKEVQNHNIVSKKHRPPRLSEIKRKTEEQPELMERLVNRVVDESVDPDDPQDQFALFASDVTARIMNCPELNVVDTSKAGQSRSRLQCERWSRGKASSYESIPEEDADTSGTANTLDPGSWLGQNLSQGSSISKQSSCESITDEFSRFMINQMETEGRGFDLLLDYYAEKNASSILAVAVQQAASKKNGHLNVRTASCLSKQSSTESITEEFYRFMLQDMDKENKENGIAKTKEWSNSLFPPSSRTPFCIRQSSVPDRLSSDSRLTVNSTIKANSFDGFARNVHGDLLNIYSANSVSATGLCKSDSCLYQRIKPDQITDMLIHETWSSSIESLMRKNKIITDPEDSIELEPTGDSQPHVQQFANCLATDIVDIGKSSLGVQQGFATGLLGPLPKLNLPVDERRRGFKQSHINCGQRRAHTGLRSESGASDSITASLRGPGDVPLIHIEDDQKDNPFSQNSGMTERHRESTPEKATTKHTRTTANSSSEEAEWVNQAPSEETIMQKSSARTVGSDGNLREILVVNCDLETESMDSEVKVALQWIAASELGLANLYLRKSSEIRTTKFQKVVQLISQRCWRVADLYSAVVHFCKFCEKEESNEGRSNLFDWLLETL